MTPTLKRGPELDPAELIASLHEQRWRGFYEACEEYLEKAREYDNDLDVGGAR